MAGTGHVRFMTGLCTGPSEAAFKLPLSVVNLVQLSFLMSSALLHCQPAVEVSNADQTAATCPSMQTTLCLHTAVLGASSRLLAISFI